MPVYFCMVSDKLEMVTCNLHRGCQYKFHSIESLQLVQCYKRENKATLGSKDYIVSLPTLKLYAVMPRPTAYQNESPNLIALCLKWPYKNPLD